MLLVVPLLTLQPQRVPDRRRQSAKLVEADWTVVRFSRNSVCLYELIDEVEVRSFDEVRAGAHREVHSVKVCSFDYSRRPFNDFRLRQKTKRIQSY